MYEVETYFGPVVKKKKGAKQCTPAYKKKKKTANLRGTLMKVHFWAILVSGNDFDENL